MSGQSVFHLHHANCKGTKFSCGFQIFWQKNTKRSVFFSKTHGVGAEVGDSYLLGTCFSITYLLETLCTSRFQQFMVGVAQKSSIVIKIWPLGFICRLPPLHVPYNPLFPRWELRFTEVPF